MPCKMLYYLITSWVLMHFVSSTQGLDADMCDGGIMYHPHVECDKFYQCSNGVPYSHSCPSGLLFNEKLSVCDWPWNVPECEGGTRPSRTTESVSSPVTSPEITTPIATTPTSTTITTTTSTTTTPTTTPTTPTTTSITATTTTKTPTTAPTTTKHSTTTTTTTFTTTTTTPNPSTTTIPSTIPTTGNPLISCGGHITTYSGTISYKPEPQYANNHRCTWYVAPPKGHIFEFELADYKYANLTNGVHIAGVEWTNGIVYSRRLHTETTGYISKGYYDAAVIKFFLNTPDFGHGFKLNFRVATISDVTFKRFEDLGNTKNPIVSYSNQFPTELSTFVYSPGFRYTGEPVEFSYKREGMASGCPNFWLLYKFNSNIPATDNNLWTLQRSKICISESDYSFRTNDAVLAIYDSATMVQGVKFTLEFKG